MPACDALAGVGEHDLALADGGLNAAEYDALYNGNKTGNAFDGNFSGMQRILLLTRESAAFTPPPPPPLLLSR